MEDKEDPREKLVGGDSDYSEHLLSCNPWITL